MKSNNKCISRFVEKWDLAAFIIQKQYPTFSWAWNQDTNFSIFRYNIAKIFFDYELINTLTRKFGCGFSVPNHYNTNSKNKTVSSEIVKQMYQLDFSEIQKLTEYSAYAVFPKCLESLRLSRSPESQVQDEHLGDLLQRLGAVSKHLNLKKGTSTQPQQAQGHNNSSVAQEGAKIPQQTPKKKIKVTARNTELKATLPGEKGDDSSIPGDAKQAQPSGMYDSTLKKKKVVFEQESPTRTESPVKESTGTPWVRLLSREPTLYPLNLTVPAYFSSHTEQPTEGPGTTSKFSPILEQMVADYRFFLMATRPNDKVSLETRISEVRQMMIEDYLCRNFRHATYRLDIDDMKDVIALAYHLRYE